MHLTRGILGCCHKTKLPRSTVDTFQRGLVRRCRVTGRYGRGRNFGEEWMV
ncbi:hypothetical protein PDIG_04210 [Penicillium digitatum PHI26]|uniref:Uncharacterized protein n=2 Tax=Penicillium digitatum TaxID=36651 RepID=K9H285_PEND2|nr:hypothetical protein PDIP_08880 [Penicillium digitatum Pd1]EKV19261.1 hypothetical protein PDIG_04210 [Penicillium digitatum PHI26]EKV21221.1 hypothetical protein PDIP_08880 [Penicillium digitatum Pd1]